MKTRVLQVDPAQPSPEALAEAASVLAGRGLVAFATETVYGLGAIASDPISVSRIYEAKGRPSFNPLIVHVATVDQARTLVSTWPERADRLAARFWPGPLTLVLPRSPVVPTIVTGGRETVALRIPAVSVARALILAAGQPLAAPSANRSNRLSPTLADHVLADLGGRIELILDSGPTSLGLESTVLDLSSGPPRILRPGPIGPEAVAECLGEPDLVDISRHAAAGRLEASPASPGMLEVHYAPRTPALRVDSAQHLSKISWPDRAGLLVFGTAPLPALPASVRIFELDDPKIAGRSLYALLHECDALNLELIVIVMPPDGREWRTIRDRLVRATRPAAGPDVERSPGPHFRPADLDTPSPGACG